MNRGYHIRMHVIDVAVRQFLQRSSSKKKVVVNLGCGSDALPWRCLSRYHDHCDNAKFIDVDFADLLREKAKIVQGTPELRSYLSGIKENTEEPVIFQSDQYAQIGSDLRDLSNIGQALSALVSVPDSEFLFIAEVSLTYMETEAADAVIRWASGFKRGKSVYKPI